MNTPQKNTVPKIAKEIKTMLRLSRSSSIPLLDLKLMDIPEAVLSFVPPLLALELLVIPVHVTIDKSGRRTLFVAVRHPRSEATLQRLMAVTGVAVRPLLAAPSDILAAILEYYGVTIPSAERRSALLDREASPSTDNAAHGSGQSPASAA